MHVPALLSRRAPGRPRVLLILRATGFGTALPLMGAALAAAALHRDGKIDHLGPVTVQPAISVVLLVPLLLSVACGIAHGTWRTPVVHRSARVPLARGVSYVAALALSMGILAVSALTSDTEVIGGVTRNLLLMTGVTVTTTALAGIAFAWLPVVLASGAAILSTPTPDPWTLHGLLFHEQTTSGQLIFAAVVCVAGAAIGVRDPISRGYLRSS